MKHVDEFERFLAEEVNLDKNRIETLTDRVDDIQKFLKGSGWQARIIRFSPQGSWAHKTIITPPGEQGFDADLLVFVNPVTGWTANDYVLTLRSIFKESGTYKNKAHLHTRCIRLEYSGDFEIDVVPCVVNRPGGEHGYEVCNRKDDEFDATDGEAFTEWLTQRNAWAGNNKLREVTRLLKYLRDIKMTFTCKSILLTTLLGERINSVDSLLHSIYFSDLPTALKTIVGRLDDYLQERPDLHEICNPVLPQENFNRHWDQDKYSNFRDMIRKYRGWIDEAYDATDEAESITKWQRIFDDEWGKSLESKALVERASRTALMTVNTSGYSDLVQVVKSAGAAILSNFKVALPWVKPAHWQNAASGTVTVNIKATLHDSKVGPPLREFSSGTPLPKYKYILFEASSPTGIPYSSNDYQVHWQVVNTHRDAPNLKQLRGGFYRSDSPGRRWEQTQYRGVHWVQAFVVRKRDGQCVGKSSVFFVVIE